MEREREKKRKKTNKIFFVVWHGEKNLRTKNKNIKDKI